MYFLSFRNRQKKSCVRRDYIFSQSDFKSNLIFFFKFWGHTVMTLTSNFNFAAFQNLFMLKHLVWLCEIL